MTPRAPHPKRLCYLVAGDSRSSIEETCGVRAWRGLADNGFVERTSVTTVGFWRDLDDDSLVVIFPKAFGTPEGKAYLDDQVNRRIEIYRLVRLFKKVRERTTLKIEEAAASRKSKGTAAGFDPVLDSFDAAIRLRNDYWQNGIYLKKSRQRAYNSPNLSLDWERTLSEGQPILNRGDLSFGRTVHKARRKDLNNPISSLQVTCLQEIFSLIGERGDFQGCEGADPSTLRRLRIHPSKVLRELRTSTFDERGRFLLGAFDAFFAESKLSSLPYSYQEKLLSFSKDFEDIWELVLRELLAPSLESRGLPAGLWHPWPEGEPSVGMRPQFDVRLEVGDTDMLVDAKDYRIFNASRWQGSNGDHYKQIIYRKLLPTGVGTKVANILAFPGLSQDSLFSIKGCHSWNEIQDSLVFEVTVDYVLAIKCWLGDITLNVQEEIQTLLSNLEAFRGRILG